MDRTFWHKQTAAKPLFPNLLWSQPENRQTAGKLLIVGGNRHSFAVVGEAYAAAQKAGIGAIQVLLPDSLRKSIGPVLAAGEFAPSTPSGSFAKKAVAEFIVHGQWADGVLLAGDFGRNSETAIVLESFLKKTDYQTVLTKDAVDFFTKAPTPLLHRPHTMIVVSIAQLQQIAQAASFPKAITFGMGLLQLVDIVHDLTNTYPLTIVVKHLNNVLVAERGQVSSTNEETTEAWRIRTAAAVSVWLIQNPDKRFEAITTAVTTL